MDQIQGEKKISFSKIMKDCEDIKLFEQESIQHIIDYKWTTYGYQFFLTKFVLYSIFILFYFLDLEQDHAENRTTDSKLMENFCKTICSIIQFFFFLYEIF